MFQEGIRGKERPEKADEKLNSERASVWPAAVSSAEDTSGGVKTFSSERKRSPKSDQGFVLGFWCGDSGFGFRGLKGPGPKGPAKASVTRSSARAARARATSG